MSKAYTFTVTLSVDDDATMAKLDEPGVTDELGTRLAAMLKYFVRDLMAPWSAEVRGPVGGA